MSQRATWFIHLESNLGISEAEGCVNVTKGSSKEEKRGHLCYCGSDGLCPWPRGMAAFRGGRTCLRCGPLVGHRRLCPLSKLSDVHRIPVSFLRVGVIESLGPKFPKILGVYPLIHFPPHRPPCFLVRYEPSSCS